MKKDSGEAPLPESYKRGVLSPHTYLSLDD